MKTMVNLLSVSMVIAWVSTAPVQAQSTSPQSIYRADSIIQPLEVIDQEGTSGLQEKLLMKINDGLVNGSISAADGSQFKTQLNNLSDQESWYRSLNKRIPANIIEKNKATLNEISQKVKPDAVRSLVADNALHSDIDELIGKALARNTISSNDAERYYLRLAQIESGLAKTTTTNVSSDRQSASSQGLRALKSELAIKAGATK